MRILLAIALCAPATARADVPLIGAGVSATVGGGVSGGDGGMGLVWSARAAIGTRRHFGLEVAYLGDSAGSTETETIEAALRFTPLPQLPWSPYAFAGVGLRRDDMRETGDSAGFPIGIGLQIRLLAGVIVDARGTHRIDASAMDSWEATAALGFEL